MPIDTTKIKNPILKRIAEGDISVLHDINENSVNITEYISFYGLTVEAYKPLTVAAYNGNTAVVKRLLAKKDNGSYEFPYVIQNIAAYNNSALRHAAQYGHIEVVNRLLTKRDGGSYEFPAVIQNIAADNNYALRFAACHGHIAIVERLLAKNDDGTYEFPDVIKNIAAMNNDALRFAACYGHIAVVKRLLAKNSDGFYEFPAVIQNIAVDDNYALRWAAEHGHIEVAKKLLAKNADGSYEFPDVIQNIAAMDNYALRLAAEKGNYEISYILAKTQWPNGVKDIPQNLRECIPAIRKGEIMVNERDAETTQLFRWLQVGYIPTSRKDLYLPPRLSSKKPQETTTLDFDVMNIVNEYAGNQRSIDTSRPTNEELTMISIKGINLLKTSSSIMSSLEKARVEREEHEHSCNNQALIPYSRLGLN